MSETSVTDPEREKDSLSEEELMEQLLGDPERRAQLLTRLRGLENPSGTLTLSGKDGVPGGANQHLTLSGMSAGAAPFGAATWPPLWFPPGPAPAPSAQGMHPPPLYLFPTLLLRAPWSSYDESGKSTRDQ